MVDLSLFDLDGDEIGALEVREELLEEEFHNDLLYRAVRAYRNNGRAGTANTKTRAEVKGSNRKPWRQKGTGRARHGSRQSPLWVGGGVTFGPKPKNYSIKLPKKMKRKAIRSALSTRFGEGRLRVIDKIEYEEPRTKRGVALLEKLDLQDGTLIILSETENTWTVRKTFSNIPTTECLPASQLNVYSLLKHAGVIVTEAALAELEDRLLDRESK